MESTMRKVDISALMPVLLGKIVCLCLLALSCSLVTLANASGDEFVLNAQFAQATPDGYPVGWYIESDSANALVSLQLATSSGGKGALVLDPADNAPVVAYTPVWASGCMESIRLQASFQPMKGSNQLSLLILNPGGSPHIGEPQETSRSGTTVISHHWEATSGCLPDNLLVGFIASGEGRLQIDGLSVSVAGKNVVSDLCPLIGTASADDIEALSQAAVVADDRSSMLKLFSQARVVGLGDNSHGSDSLFRFKQELIEFLVTQLDFDLFALEMPAEPATVVNAYIQGEEIDRQELLKALSYPAWQSVEMMAVFDWLRIFNLDARHKVQLIGLDINKGSGDTDTQMFQVLKKAIGDSSGSTRAVIWADNTHVTIHGAALGAKLRGTFGDEYVAVGMTFNRGNYFAYGPEKSYSVQPGYPGTFEYALAQVGPDKYLLPLSRLSHSHPFYQIGSFRYIGSAPQHYHQFYPHRLTDHFDVIGFASNTSPTSLLVDHEF